MMMTDDEEASSGTYVIAVVLVFGMIAGFLFMRHMMLNQSKSKMVV
jgi:hypothetical protein